MSPTAVNYPPSPPSAAPIHSPPITVILTIVLLIFFLLGFFSIYFCRCIMEAVFHTWNLRRSPSGHLAGASGPGIIPAHTGLDPALVKSLPTFLYSTVKDVRKEKYGLECAICLAEFRDDSLLRLLTVCYHVFHQECVDLWLESHKTCPVCRRDLESTLRPDFPAKSPEIPPTAGGSGNSGTGEGSPANDVAIDVKDDDNDVIRRRFEEYRRKFHRRNKNPRVRVCNTDERTAAKSGGGGGGGVGERFTRSHSTGHSIVKLRSDEEDDHDDHDGEEDRYTLRLPEHMRMRILRARHWTASCETYGDFERRRIDRAIV